MSTAGGLLFTGTSDGYVKAFDAKTGKAVEIPDRLGIVSSPVTWEQDGEQYIGLASGYGGAGAAVGRRHGPTDQAGESGQRFLGVQAAAPHPAKPILIHRLPPWRSPERMIQGFLMMLTLPRLALALESLAVALARR